MRFNCSLVILAAFCSCFILIGCGKQSTAGQSCQIPQNPTGVYQQVTASAAPTTLKLIVKMTDDAADFAKFRQELAWENAQPQDYFQKIDLRWIADQTYSISIHSHSRALKVIENAIAQQKITELEPDYATFSTEPMETATDNLAFNNDENTSALDLASTGPPAPAPESAIPGQEVSGQKRRQIIVAVIDTGVDYTHKDLAPYIWKNLKEIPANGIDDDKNGYIDDVMGWDFANNDNDPMADDTRGYHGTHVAGIVRTASQLAQQGIDVKIMPLKYLDSSASGLSSNAIRAIDYAIQNGATILNNSWGSMSGSKALSDAIERARQANVLFVAAAGNGDAMGNGINIDQQPYYPAAYPHDNIISVAASDNSGKITSFSNFGAHFVDISAPGLKILSTRNGNTYGVLSGTSMASPYIAGVAAMLWGMRSDLSYREIKKVLFRSVEANVSLKGKVSTGGMVSPLRVLQMAASFAHDPNEKYSSEFTDGQNQSCTQL